MRPKSSFSDVLWGGGFSVFSALSEPMSKYFSGKTKYSAQLDKILSSKYVDPTLAINLYLFNQISLISLSILVFFLIVFNKKCWIKYNHCKLQNIFWQCKEKKRDSSILCTQQCHPCWMSTTEWRRSEYVYFSTPVSLLQKITGLPLSEEDEQIWVCQRAKTWNAWWYQHCQMAAGTRKLIGEIQEGMMTFSLYGIQEQRET